MINNKLFQMLTLHENKMNTMINTYLRHDIANSIHEFLTVKEILRLVPCISNAFHYYIQHTSQRKLLQTCFTYDFGNLLDTYKLQLFDDNKTNTASMKRFYTDWNTFRKLLWYTSKYPQFDLRILSQFERAGCVYHWLNKVMYKLFVKECTLPLKLHDVHFM